MENYRRKMPLPGKILLIAAGLICLAAVVLGIFRLADGLGGPARQQLKLGQRYLDELDYEAAVIAFTDALDIDPRSFPAYVGRGQAYLGLGEYQTAEEDFTAALALDDRSVDAYIGLARSHAGQGDTDAALEDLSNAEDNGLSQEEADTLREEIAGVIVSPDGFVWLLQPTYDCADINPLPVEPLTLWRWAEEGYSPLPQYYWLCWDFDRYSGTVLDMDTMLTLSGTEPSRFDFVQPFTVPQTVREGAFVPSHLALSMDKTDAVSDTFAGGTCTFGDVSVLFDCETTTGFVQDLSSGSILATIHTNLSGPTDNDFVSLEAASSQLDGLKKPVAVCRWDLGGIIDLTEVESDHYLLFDSSPDTRYEDIATQPDTSAWAFVSPDGTLLTDYLYEDTVDYSCGIAAAQRDGKWGYLDETGTPVTDFVYDGNWQNATYPGRLQAFPCTCDTMVVSQNGQVGLLYRDGSVLIDFGRFEDLAPAYNDRLWAKEDGLWGLIDLNAVKEAKGLMPETAPDSEAAEDEEEVLVQVASFNSGTTPSPEDTSPYGTHYLYDADGHLTRELEDGNSRVYTLDADGNPTRRDDYLSDGTLYQSYTYTWDAQGNMLSEISWSDDKTTTGTFYTYDSEGNLVQAITKSSPDWSGVSSPDALIPSQATDYTYSGGRLVRSSQYSLEDSYSYTRTIDYIYDEAGRLIREDELEEGCPCAYYYYRDGRLWRKDVVLAMDDPSSYDGSRTYELGILSESWYYDDQGRISYCRYYHHGAMPGYFDKYFYLPLSEAIARSAGN